MGEIVVPIDITQEEKSVLAIFLIRQFFLVVPTGFFMIAFIIWGNIPFIDGAAEFIVKFILFLFVSGIAILLAYIKLDKYEMYLSELVKVLWLYSRSQKTYQNL